MPTVSNPSVVVSESELIGSICKDSFYEFVQYAWDHVPGSEKLVLNWHIEYICEELQEAAERVFRNETCPHDLVFNVPPGTSKSTIISILFPAWVWTRFPKGRFICSSHTSDLVLDLANKSREVIQSEWYKGTFVEVGGLKEDQNAKGNFANEHGGSRKSCTVSGKSPVGFHAHFLLVDDAIDPQKALSQAELKTAAHFMTNVLPSRKIRTKTDPAVTILVMQRLGLGDPTDVMMKESEKDGAIPVRHFCLPSELDKNEDGTYDTSAVSPHELADKYIDGLLDHHRLPMSVLKQYKAKGALYYATQFKQKPYSASGGRFEEWMFNQRVIAAPYASRRIRYYDRASTQGGGCATAGVLLAIDSEGEIYIEHVVHGHWEPKERNEHMLATAMRDRSRYGPKYEPTIHVEREGGSSGRDAWKGIAKALAGFNVREHNVSGMGNKVTRSEPWSAQLAAKNVWVVDNGESKGSGKSDWNIEEYVKEHCAFPLGELKDRVDASSGGYSVLIGARPASSIRCLPLSPKRKGLIKILACSDDELATMVVVDHSAIMVHVEDPYLEDEEPPDQPKKITHALSKLVDEYTMQTSDIEPSEYQDTWDQPVEGYNKTPDQLVLTREQGKALWSFLLKKRDLNPELIVFTSPDGKRSLSLAYAVADAFRLNRKEIVYTPSAPESKHEEPPPNPYMYIMTKTCRSMVM